MDASKWPEPVSVIYYPTIFDFPVRRSLLEFPFVATEDGARKLQGCVMALICPFACTVFSVSQLLTEIFPEVKSLSRTELRCHNSKLKM